MADRTPARIALLGLNIALAASWAWFAVDAIGPLAAMVIALAALAGEALLTRRIFFELASVPAGRSPERIATLIGRGEPRRHAIRDESTGLFNRWYLEQRIEQEALRCDRYDHSMAVIVLRAGIVDLAEFSLDQWQSQSAVTADRCIKVVRNIDLSAFLAPFEFAICLIQCDHHGAEKALSRLREEFSDFAVDAGVGVYPDDGCEPLALIDLARVRSRRPATVPVARDAAPAPAQVLGHPAA
jgi:GGDEF domain-containing protein